MESFWLGWGPVVMISLGSIQEGLLHFDVCGICTFHIRLCNF
jgi:hypothetical protein